MFRLAAHAGNGTQAGWDVSPPSLRTGFEPAVHRRYVFFLARAVFRGRVAFRAGDASGVAVLRVALVRVVAFFGLDRLPLVFAGFDSTPNSRRSSSFACSRIFFRSAGKPRPARLMKNVSIDIAER